MTQSTLTLKTSSGNFINLTLPKSKIKMIIILREYYSDIEIGDAVADRFSSCSEYVNPLMEAINRIFDS